MNDTYEKVMFGIECRYSIIFAKLMEQYLQDWTANEKVMIEIECRYSSIIAKLMEQYLQDWQANPVPYTLWQEKDALEDDLLDTGHLLEWKDCTETPDFKNRYKQFRRKSINMTNGL